MHKDSSGNSNNNNKQMDSSKYVRYAPEQVEALDRVYPECPKPSSLRRQQLIRESPILCNIEPNRSKSGFRTAGSNLFIPPSLSGNFVMNLKVLFFCSQLW
ncbi:hypothetical protein TIFTF001_037176 [Ficus carica]|uniref:Uncharacterized protein n=1 Tax=Ficus carica TaxID=3494 RepID=A0AA88E4T1_FICCA|nr:hypothetical protein TIFTF001_037176 [Ficus carica]